MATASRKDYAEAAAVVLTTPAHEGKAYELSGDTTWNYNRFTATAGNSSEPQSRRRRSPRKKNASSS